MARDAHGPRWFPARTCKRDDKIGTWPCQDLAGSWRRAPAPKPATTSFAKTADPRHQRLAPSLVLVNFDMPYSVSGITERSYYGTGLIVDAERGLVIVDRNTVPVALGDVRLTFAGTIEVPGRVEYVHPLHNLAVVSYDPALIGDDAGAQRATFKPVELRPGEQVWASACAPTARCSRGRPRSRRSIPSLTRCRARCSSATPISRRSAW